MEELIKFDNILTREFFNQHFVVVHRIRDSIHNDLKEAFYCNNLVYSFKVVGILYVLATVLNWFSFFTLLWEVVILAFSVPVLYNQFKPEIDNALLLASSQIIPYYNLVLEKVPMLNTKKEN